MQQDYKNTLNLPKTDFAMKADLSHKEPLILESWLKNDIYKLIVSKNKSRPKYVLHDGPPYANGNIHIGHALNKTLKDVVVKYKTMSGFNSSYVPGWDCHGLPVEHQLFKELGIGKDEISQSEFRKKAYLYALKFVSIQKEEFKRLGVFGDWDNPYLTVNRDYEYAIVKSFGELVRKGYIYHGLKPVNWCFVCETALAEAEVEYVDHTSPSIFVKFRLEDNKIFPKDTYLVIWTTTPWTLLANVAVAVHPNLVYSHLKTEQGDLVIADVRLPALSEMGIDKYEVIKTFKGKDMDSLLYSHPLGIRKGRLVLADYVSREEGTGLVHTAPGHGLEDYSTGQIYKLETVMPVNVKGEFDSTAGEFQGFNVFAANEKIIKKLSELKMLLYSGSLTHSYPHCWRCKNPVIFRATKQWFMNIDHKDLRKKILAKIPKIKWIPSSGQERIIAMVGLRPDWCLSRQRYWGVPIPSVVCADCSEEILDSGVIENFAKFVLKEGTDCWIERDLKDFLPANFKCPKCKNNNFSKKKDILDVWFDSGVSHQAVLKTRKDLAYPADLYLEGTDQHRGWFQASLIPSMAIDNESCFKAVLTHGFVVDGLGRKMSKSVGNVIAPQEVIKDFGADILRLWVASSDYNEDIRISQEILSRLSEGYRKIRNTIRFTLSNLYDFNPDKDKVRYKNLKKIDKWVLWKLEGLLDKVNKSYDKFEFYKVYQDIYNFCNIELSAFYLDMVKGRLYTYAANSLERRAAQTAIYEVLNVLVRVMAPVLVFTAEEIFQNMPKEKKDNTIISVHLLDWPPKFTEFAQGSTELEPIIELVPEVAKALEEKRSQGIIGSSFDAKIKLLTKTGVRYKFLQCLECDLPEIFKVSQVEIIRQGTSGTDSVKIEIEKAQGQKCSRCWNYSHTVGSFKEHPLICDRCVKAL